MLCSVLWLWQAACDAKFSAGLTGEELEKDVRGRRRGELGVEGGRGEVEVMVRGRRRGGRGGGERGEEKR